MTFNEHGQVMLDQLTEQLADSTQNGLALRDLALSRTHLEDALTRYNSAQYRKRGIWKRADPDNGDPDPMSALRGAVLACIGDAEGQEAVAAGAPLTLTAGQVQLLASVMERS